MSDFEGGQAMTEYYNGYTIGLEHDQDADNPLMWTAPEDRGAWFALRHRRYALPFEIDADTDDYQGWAELAGAVTAPGGNLAGRVYQFVQWYEHGGVVVNLSDTDQFGGWDTGCAGVIFGDSRAAILGSFAEWKAYVEGEVYTVNITAPDGNEVCTLGGMYGYGWTMNWVRRAIDEDAKLTGVNRIRRYGRAHAPRARELHA